MSIDQLAFIIENCYACKFEAMPLYVVIKFQLHQGDNWQQIEVAHSVYASLERRYPKIVNKWIVEGNKNE